MTVRLRAHHLLCVLTYVGRGYSAAFTANYDRVLGRLAAGEGIELVSGPDEVCGPLLGDPDAHCRLDRIRDRDEAAARAIAALLDRAIAPGDRIDVAPELVARLRAAFRDGTIRAACAGCEWSDLCTAVAAAGFAGARLRPS